MSYHVNVTFRPDPIDPPWMEASDVLMILEKHAGDLPETNFVAARDIRVNVCQPDKHDSTHRDSESGGRAGDLVSSYSGS